MQTSYKTHEAAQADLIADGFTRFLSCINGAERFSKPSKVDDMMGGYARTCIASIQHHGVAPQWGDDRNYFTIKFI